MRLIHKALKKKKIGIFGGTFNPPHNGHLRTSLIALEILGLDEIWWVVALTNPLKSFDNENNNDFFERFQAAKKFVASKKIFVSDLEMQLNTPYTADVISYLKYNMPNNKFIWIMGADNCEHFHLWKNWKNIFSQVPIAIFDRPFYSLFVSKSMSFNHYKKYRLNDFMKLNLKNKKPPCWVFIKGWPNRVSSTQLKK